MKLAPLLLLVVATASAQMRLMTLPAKSPLVTFRIVFAVGSAADPADKPGTAYLTAMMLARGGSRELAYQQILDAMFPMAASLNAQVDKEMVTFSGSAHTETLERYYPLLRAMLLEPGWREEDFHRVKADAINSLRVNLRGNNDEELAKEVLEADIYKGTPYGPYSMGTVSSLERITLDDLKRFYRTQFTQANLILGIAGGYTPAFLERMKKDFRTLPDGAGFRPRDAAPGLIGRNRAIIVEKDTRSVAISFGFPSVVTRIHPDYAALLLITSYLGQHRSSNGVLYDQMREKRGLNYGDYAYLEYFPRGMFQFEPSPNLVRQYLTWQVWIRPVEPPAAAFALRLALYELGKLATEGMSQEAFERTRDFLVKNVNLLTRTRGAELGYAIDSLYYGNPPYNDFLKTQLAKLTRAEVNSAAERYLRRDKLVIVAVAKNAAELKRTLTSGEPSPMTYNAPKPAAILEEDKIVERFPLRLDSNDVTVIPVDQVFE